MKDEKKALRKNSRRFFLQKGLLGGALTFLGLQSAKAATEEEETVKMLTADGKLVEIPKKFVPKKSGKVVSNKELREWVNEKK